MDVLKTLLYGKQFKGNHILWQHGQYFAVRKVKNKLVGSKNRDQVMLFALKAGLFGHKDITALKQKKVTQR
jgi:hypothetical protein